MTRVVDPTSPSIAPAGDSGFCVRFGASISHSISALVMGALAALDGRRPPAVLDVMPGYASLLVLFDPARAAPAEVQAWLEAALARSAPAAAEGARCVEIPVFYHPRVAPDLEPLAAEKGLTVDALIARHAAPLYRCHMLGFRPGFPFLGGLDPALASARLATPRLSVPAGSVGIGGRQTGVYPGAGPGGWRIIGRTPLALFRPSAPEPFLVQPGDRVRFVPMDEATFEAVAEGTR
jgi:inhibitor of KinA